MGKSEKLIFIESIIIELLSVDLRKPSIEFTLDANQIIIYPTVYVKDDQIKFSDVEKSAKERGISLGIMEQNTSWWERNGTKFGIVIGSITIASLILAVIIWFNHDPECLINSLITMFNN